MAYRDNDEVEPTPGVGEILLEAERQPLEEHLEHEDDGVELVEVGHDHLECGALRFLVVDVFDGQRETARHDHGDDERFEVLVFDQLERVAAQRPEFLADARA